MKVLIVAPKICTPWTEGRKKFVVDLIDEAEGKWSLCGLVTQDPGEHSGVPDGFEVIEVRRSADHILCLLDRLATTIRRHQPDLVCLFPFGVFAGIRGLANLWLIKGATRICKKWNVPCFSLMYSLTDEASTPLLRMLLRGVYYNQFSNEARTIRFGVKLPPATKRIRAGSIEDRALLFMSGAADESIERLNYVLDVRGLRLLLQAGKALSALNFRLIVAIPFLKCLTLRARLEALEDNEWEAGRITWLTEVDVPNVYENVAAFVFPYNQEENQFVPTSVVEAMHFGIPVIYPRLEFLAFFAREQVTGLVFEPGNVTDLIEKISWLKTRPAFVHDICANARRHVAEEFDIGNTVKDIEAAYRRLGPPP